MKQLSVFCLIGLFVVNPKSFPIAMSADDAVSFQYGPSALSFLLLCTGSSKDQICFTDFACFQVSSALLCSDMACPDGQVSFLSLPAFGPKQTQTMRKTNPSSTFSYIPAAYL